jgi:hypothetical protein
MSDINTYNMRSVLFYVVLNKGLSVKYEIDIVVIVTYLTGKCKRIAMTLLVRFTSTLD